MVLGASIESEADEHTYSFHYSYADQEIPKPGKYTDWEAFKSVKLRNAQLTLAG
jgi:hypothetical protein